MTTITLQDYCQQIDDLIEEQRFDEAVTHCRHILQQYPHHIETYRIWARALLEKGDYSGAVDLLQRALSVNPSDFVAHVGMSMAYKEDQMLPQSIWHLERAMEIRPYNAALQEELQDLYAQSCTAVPDRITPSQGALARLYLESEMYLAAAQELRQSLSQDEDRIDLKVLLAEILWWDNQRVESVALCLSILDELPNCIQANAILGQVWLQTGRIEEAQTYLNRLQALTQMDKAHCSNDSVVCHALLSQGAPPLPEKVTITYLEDDAQHAPDEESPTADWVDEFTLAEATERGEPAEEDAVPGWLSGVPLETADDAEETAVATPGNELASPASPIQAETDWFVDTGDQTDDDVSDLIGDLGKASGLTGWLIDDAGDDAAQPADLDSAEPADLDMTPELGGQEDLDSPGITDLFARLDEMDETDPAEIASESFDEGLTDLFADMSIDDEPVIQGDAAVGQQDDEVDDFFADLVQDESETAVQDADLSALAQASETEDDFHTGYTQLFDELSGDAFPEEETANWLGTEADMSEPDAEDESPSETVSDWLSEATDADFEPVQIDNRFTTDWLTPQDEPDAAAASRPTDAEESETTAADGQLSDADDKIPTWMLGGEQEVQEFETPPPLDSAAGLLFDADDSDQLNDLADLADDAAVPTWLLGGDQAMEETGDLDLPPITEEARSETPDQTIEDDLADLSSQQLPDWLLDNEVETGTESTDYLAADSGAEPLLELSGEPDLVDSGEELPNWLLDDTPTGQDELEVAVIDDNDKREIEPQEEPEDITEGASDDDGLTGWLEQLAVGRDDAPEEPATLTDEDDSASFASRVAGGEGGAIDELPTQASLPEETPDAGEGDDVQSEDDLDWLEQLGNPVLDPTDEQITLDWSQDDEELEDVLAGVTGELQADLDWLDTLAEETNASLEVLPPGDDEAAETGTDELEWLNELGADEDTGPLDDYGAEPALPEFENTLADLPDEPDDAMDWLAELEMDSPASAEAEADADAAIEGDIEAELAPELTLDSEPELSETTAVSDAPDDLDDAMAWLETLAVQQGAPLEELPSVTEAAEVEPALPDALEADADSEAGLAGGEAQADMPEDLDDAMNWLEELAAKQGAPLEELPSIAEVVDESLPAELELAETMPEPAPPPELTTSEQAAAPDLAEALDWLEQMARAEGVELDEVSMVETAVPVSENELADALDWLEQMAQPDEEPLIPPAVDAVSTVLEDDLINLTDEMPDDPDEALVWLQQWAIDEDIGEVVGLPDDEVAAAPAGELDSDELDSEPKSDTTIDLTDTAIEEEMLSEIPDDPDAAMAWLEQLAAQQGAPLEELPSVTADAELTPVVDSPVDAAPESQDAIASQDDLARALDEAASEADDAADWLDELAEAEADPLAEIPEFAEVLDIEPEVVTAAPEVEPDATDGGVPEDMDEAMAWLEELAVQQGAALEELPSLSEKPDTQPELLEIETAVENGVDLAEPVEPTVTAPSPSAAETAPIDDETDDSESELAPVEDLADAMPGWLDLETEQAVPGQTEWLTSLDEPDVIGWLEAEEDASLSSGIYDRSIASRFDPQPDALFDTGPLPPEVGLRLDTGPLTLPEEELITSVLELNETDLHKARAAVADGALDEALQLYQDLVETGGGLMTLIADLESAADAYSNRPLFRRLLGDAYMQNGQLQKALDTYRMALDQI